MLQGIIDEAKVRDQRPGLDLQVAHGQAAPLLHDHVIPGLEEGLPEEALLLLVPEDQDLLDVALVLPRDLLLPRDRVLLGHPVLAPLPLGPPLGEHRVEHEQRFGAA